MDEIKFGIKNMVRACIVDEINNQIDNKVKEFKEQLESRKDQYIAEVMKGIRIAHESRLGEVTYKIVFENIVHKGDKYDKE